MKYLRNTFAMWLFVVLVTPYAQAVPITSDLTINGEVSFDITSSLAEGNAIQTATLFSVLGGTNTNSTVSNTTVTGDNPKGGQLTDIGDGIGLSSSLESSGIGFSDVFAFDYAFQITNNSLSQDYTISFLAEFENSVNSELDAFVESRFILEDSSNTEFFFTDLSSDTLVGNEKNGNPTGNTGGVESDFGTFGFDIVVAAGQMLTFTGEVKLDGESFVNDSFMLSSNDSFISILSVSGSGGSTNPPNPVPSPYPALLFLAGCVGVVVRRVK
ncbi:hypothetical protein [Agaribacter flavus]|uniref:PEP-CTERM protein-sorting domain-containing protein n=1 Tax=Agaribacter flavus TaxID=1902781 RepID=A0ABV7FNE4_9ALTE